MIPPTLALACIEAELNDRRGFHVDTLDAETRADLLAALYQAAHATPDQEVIAMPDKPTPTRPPLRLDEAQTELMRVAIAWVLADREADKRTDELEIALADTTAGAQARDRAQTAFELAAVKEQTCDEAFREVAKQLVRDLGL